MEVIEIAGYTLEEKKDIAEQYLIPKVLLENGLLKKQFKLSSSVLTTLIKHYTREPGVRSLEQCLAQCARKVVVELTLKNRDAPTLTESLLTQWLGPQKFDSERTIKVTQPGIVTGLAWTAMGGEILPIEVTNYAGTGQLKLTGQIRDVMTESASIAWSFVKKHLPDHYADFYKNNDIHLHIPAGAIPKDGPSAGITMATAFYSLLTRQPLRNTLAMTGELSLVGRVLPIGGLKEKLLAAQRAGITEVVVPLKNKKDVLLFSKKITQGLKVYYAENMEDVLKICFSEIKNKQKKIQKKMKTQKNIEFRKTTITRTNKNLMN
jgi:ATP-dependent Lon protease